MRKIFCMILLTVLAALGFGPGQPVAADTLHYSVAAELPSNQIDRSLAYFALRVTPDTTQTLHVTITNNDTTAHRFALMINRAGTNANGAIDYTKHGVKAAAHMPADLERMATASAVVTIAAHTTQAVPITLHTPAARFAGLVLGGVRIQELTAAKQTSGNGVQLNNQFAYVIGIALQEAASYANIKPNLVLASVAAAQRNYHNTITVHLANPQPNLIHHLKLTAAITKQGRAKPDITVTKSKMTMAPNSTFAYPIATANQPLQAGRYTLELAASASGGKYHWHFTKHFTITSTHASKLNATAVGLKPAASHRWLNFLLSLTAGLLLIVLILAGSLLHHRRRQ